MTSTPPVAITAVDQLKHALAADVHPKLRRGQLRCIASDLGLDEMRWSHWAPAWLARFSMFGLGSVIFSRRVVDGARRANWSDSRTEVGEIDLLASFIHELAHAARAAAMGALKWRLLYILWPPFRRAEELEADAHGIALRVRMLRVRPTCAYTHQVARDNAEAWTGWRSPYFCGGDVDAYTIKLLKRVEALLDASARG